MTEHRQLAPRGLFPQDVWSPECACGKDWPCPDAEQRDAIDTVTEPLDLDAIRERLHAATPGPWEHEESGNMGAGSVFTLDPDLAGGIIAEPGPDPYPRSGYNPKADMVFIAHARDDVAELVEAVLTLTAERDAMRPVVEALSDFATGGSLAALRAALDAYIRDRS